MTELIKAVTKTEVKAIIDTLAINDIIGEINQELMEEGRTFYYFALDDVRIKTVTEHFMSSGWNTSVEIKDTPDDIFNERMQMLYIY